MSYEPVIRIYRLKVPTLSALKKKKDYSKETGKIPDNVTYSSDVQTKCWNHSYLIHSKVRRALPIISILSLTRHITKLPNDGRLTQ